MTSTPYSNHQYGFRKGRNTAGAVKYLVKEIFEAFVNRNFLTASFCDLSKAFDCVDHEVLLCKLKYYGFQANEHSFFKSYSTERSQCVVLNGNRSNKA